MHISLVNLDPSKPISIQTTVEGNWKGVSGRIISSANLTDINTFEQPAKVIAVAFTGAKLNGNILSVELPAKSLVTLELK
jgi:alpha-N-arabinofuranosidase